MRVGMQYILRNNNIHRVPSEKDKGTSPNRKDIVRNAVVGIILCHCGQKFFKSL